MGFGQKCSPFFSSFAPNAEGIADSL